jgi:hypothetical protein
MPLQLLKLHSTGLLYFASELIMRGLMHLNVTNII